MSHSKVREDCHARQVYLFLMRVFFDQLADHFDKRSYFLLGDWVLANKTNQNIKDRRFFLYRFEIEGKLTNLGYKKIWVCFGDVRYDLVCYFFSFCCLFEQSLA